MPGIGETLNTWWHFLLIEISQSLNSNNLVIKTQVTRV